jgi:hypothetical protein
MMVNYQEKRLEAIKQLIPTPISGKGLVNSLINKIPFEMHLPGYQYAGPGTHLDLRLAKGIKPKNKLDEAAMSHDIAYSKSKKLSDRHAADKILQEEAWNRVKAADANLGEKAMAWLTTNTMRAKRAIGAGLQPSFIKTPVDLDESQKGLILSALEKKKPVELKLNLFRTKASVMNETSLPLTQSQIKRVDKARKENKSSIKIKLSTKQVQHFKSGGFLPALLAGVPALASVLGTVYNSYQNKKANDRLVEERIRALDGKGLYMTKKPKALGEGVRRRRGKGLYMTKKPKALGEGVKQRTVGNGLLKELLKKKKSHSVE